MFGRNYIRKLIIDNKLYENIIKIQVDSVILDKPYEFSKDSYNPLIEEKSTGAIYFVSLNEIYHKCRNKNCENFFKYKNCYFCEICK